MVRRRNQRGRGQLRVEPIQDLSSPVSVQQVAIDDVFKVGTATSYHLPTIKNLPSRPTSLVLDLSSIVPTAWIIKAYSAATTTFESRPFTTCGNSITVRVKNSKNAQYSASDLTTNNICWSITAQVQVPVGGGSPTGGPLAMACGTATFSSKGVAGYPDA